jgi:hypothetical protein
VLCLPGTMPDRGEDEEEIDGDRYGWMDRGIHR